VHVTARMGDTSDGGGESYRLQLSGGHESKNLSFIGGIEIFKRELIMANQRSFMDSLKDNPSILRGDQSLFNDRNYLILDPFDSNRDGLKYIDPGKETCQKLGSLEGGSLEYSFRNDFGYYCGSHQSIASHSIRNANNNLSAYLNGSYRLNNQHEVFLTSIFTKNETEFNTGSTFWDYHNARKNNKMGAHFLNQANINNSGKPTAELWQRIFSTNEMGDNNTHIFENSSIITTGLKGETFFGFEYEFGITFSKYNINRKRRLIHKKSADTFFLGPLLQQVNKDGSIWNVHNAPHSNLYRALTPKEYQSITGIDSSQAQSQNITTTLVLSHDSLIEVPAGDVGLALVIEKASQKYKINLDPRLINNEWYQRRDSKGKGKRKHSAMALEVGIPITDTIQTTLAARWDQYNDISDVDDAITYNIGIEYRPFQSLLLRSTYATSFRAPDMHYIYANESGFFTNITDQYLCRKQQLQEITTKNNINYNNCLLNKNNNLSQTPFYRVPGFRSGIPTLKEEEGKTATLGFVWDVIENLNISFDYYQIEIKNVVRDQSTYHLLSLEADCRLGKNIRGTESYDINSVQCQDVINRVNRKPISQGFNSELIDSIRVSPMNSAFRRTSGYDLSMKYHWNSGYFGRFGVQFDYNYVAKDESQGFAGDPIQNIRNRSLNLRSSTSTSLNWEYGDWNTTLFSRRTGSTLSFGSPERCCININYNLSVGYQIMDNLHLSLFVQNLRNKSPQKDSTYTKYPYYMTQQYNPYGREYSLQVDYNFGG
jgi:outer membrane receptor protein involved in Fe transport